MHLTVLTRMAAAATLGPLLVLGACASDQPMPQSQSGAPMAREDAMGRPAMVYRSPNLNARKYTKYMIDPVAIYRGTDTEWAGASQADIQELAAFLRSELVRALGDRYAIVTAAGPDVARLKLTLAGLEGNTAVVAPVSRVLPVGAVANIYNQANQTMISFVQKRGPDALDFGATLSNRDAHRAAVTSFADAFRKRVDQVHAGG
jgi:hypothetical protein